MLQAVARKLHALQRQRRQVRQCPQLSQARAGCVGAGEIQRVKFGKRQQMHQACIRDLRIVEPNDLKLRITSKCLEPLVADAGAVQAEILQKRKIRQRGQTRVVDRQLLERQVLQRLQGS